MKKPFKETVKEKLSDALHFVFIGLMLVLAVGYIYLAVRGYKFSNVSRKDWISAASGFFLSVSFIFVTLQLRQTHRDQKHRESWERTKFITEQLGKFRSDPDVADVKDMLDSIDSTVPRRMMLPDEQGNLVLTLVTRSMLINAFTIGKLSGKRCHSLAELSIAKKFDVFFSYFIGFGEYKRTGIIEADHLQPYLYYWYESVVEIDKATNKVVTLQKRLRTAETGCHSAEQELRRLQAEGSNPTDIGKAKKTLHEAQEGVASAKEALEEMREIEPEATRVREQMKVYRDTYFENFEKTSDYLKRDKARHI